MRARYEIWVSDARGNRIRLAANLSDFAIARALNSAGEFWINLPPNFDMTLVPLDNLVEFWRASESGPLSLFGVGIIKERERWTRGRRIAGPDQMDILHSRIIAYPAGHANTEITDQYDDMMKAIIRANLGSSSTDTNRDLTTYNLTVEADAALAPSGTLSFAWANCLDTLIKIAGASREAGTELYFDLVPVIQADQSIGFDFRTYINQPGQDRTDGTQNPVFFGEKWGNLQDGKLVENSRDEINYVYVGGSGVESDRIIEEVSNATRIGRSPWNRREGFVDYSNASDSDTLYSAGLAELIDARPLKRFSGKLIDTPKARFGVDWGLGYRVTCDHDGEQFDALVRYIEITVEEQRETIKAAVEVDE